MQVVHEGVGGPVQWLRLQPDEGREDVVFSEAGFDELAAALTSADQSASCRLIVLAGTPGIFCRGMDLEALVADPERHAHHGTVQYAACLTALHDARKVVVSLVDGVASAGGLGLAAAADWLIATRASTFSLPEPVVGMVPAMVLPLLHERMSVQKARRFVLGGRSLAADDAAALGLVDQVVEQASDLEAALRSVAKQVLRLEPGAVARLKRLSRELAHQPWTDGVRTGRQCTADMLLEPERIAHIARFLGGESPPWFVRYRSDGGAR